MFTIFFLSNHKMPTNVVAWRGSRKRVEWCCDGGVREGKTKEIDVFRALGKKITEYLPNVLASLKPLYYNKTVAEWNRELWKIRNRRCPVRLR